ncbi:MAG: hypothetical protein IT379_12035 [Deltaproteobacteria bacterium]|nr:hypothetical protein [Deltaproteobacteria bacterium]
MRTKLAGVLWLGLLVLPSVCGCNAGSKMVAARPCSSSADCAGGLVCRDGMCSSAPGTDGGPDTGAVDLGTLADFGSPDAPPTGCVDLDGDRRGAGGCPLGEDCDDTNAMRGGVELCDRIDNDCDGETDEGLIDICAECVPGCEATETPGDPGWMPGADNAEGVIVDEEGALTLGRMETMSFFVWVAAMDEGTVSKLDSRTNMEVARYPAVGAMAPAGTRPWNEACNWMDQGNCPSRTAVDQNFDAFVANRAFGNQGSVTKYANREEDCIDRNANGTIDTSRDANGDGSIDISNPAEFVGPDDECILWTASVGGANGVPRAMSIGLAPPDGIVGDVWVGLFNQTQACRLSSATGATVGCYDIGGFHPYGAATDGDGRIWMVDRSVRPGRDILGWLDPVSTAFTIVSPMPAAACEAVPYGMTVSPDGSIFLANNGCRPNIYRYQPSTDSWLGFSTPSAASVRGVAADEAHLWACVSHGGDNFDGGEDNRVEQFRLADLGHVATHHLPTGLAPVGCGVSFDGSVWAIAQSNNLAARLDPATGAWTERTVGLHPYTYSDFIGYGLNVFSEPRGRYRFVVEGCSTGTNVWQGLRFDGELPPMTAVEIWVRSADTRDGLTAEEWIGPFVTNPANLTAAPGPVPERRFLEVELRLRTDDRRAAPRIFDVTVAGICEPIIG